MEEKIAQLLKDDFKVIEIVNQSHLHAGHIGFGQHSHFLLVLQSPSMITFRQRREQERKVYHLLSSLYPSVIHSISLSWIES